MTNQEHSGTNLNNAETLVRSHADKASSVSVGASRRQFVKTFALGAAFSTLVGKPWMGTLLAECTPAAAGDGVLRIRVSDFPALAAEKGSVRLALNPFTSNRPNGKFYPILINRGAGDQFYALSSRCMHLGCVVPQFNAASNSIVCPCHGSRYGIDGAVKNGPTTEPLIQYPYSYDGTTLCVEVPQLGFSVAVTTVLNGSTPRLRLGFSTFQGAKYEIRYRLLLSDAGTVVPFSTTPDGGATTMELSGDGHAATLYVDNIAASGFYAVALKVSAA